MSFDLAGLIQIIALAAIPVTFAITLHEAAHGYVARHFGDYTAHNAGRISLNPLRHIDPVGTIAVPLLILVTSKLMGRGGILFGWAKPVPVNFGQLRHPKRDMLWVAAAGPGAEPAHGPVLGARCCKLAARRARELFLGAAAGGMAQYRTSASTSCSWCSILFPLPPLDGGRIAVSLLPGQTGVALREDRTVWLYNSADAAVHRRSGRDALALHPGGAAV